MTMVEIERPGREVGITATYCIDDNDLIDGSFDSNGGKEGGAKDDGNNTPPPSSSTSRPSLVYYFRSDGTTTTSTTTTTINGDHDEVVGESKNEIIRFGLPEGVDVHNPGKVRENRFFFWVALLHLDRSFPIVAF